MSDLGVLSKDEEMLRERPVENSLRARLSDQQHENEDLREHFATQIKERLSAALPWELIEQYATCAARAYYFKCKREEMGFAR